MVRPGSTGGDSFLAPTGIPRLLSHLSGTSLKHLLPFDSVAPLRNMTGTCHLRSNRLLSSVCPNQPMLRRSGSAM